MSGSVGDFITKKVIERITDNPRMEVLIYNEEGVAEVCSFYASAVRLQSRTADKSMIVFPDGEEVMLSLSYAELIAKVEQGRSPIDLKAYCQSLLALHKGAPLKLAAVAMEQDTSHEEMLIGQYFPEDDKGRSLGFVFNVFAAPQDLSYQSGNKKVSEFKYTEVLDLLATLKSWHGFDGAMFPTQKDLNTALKKGKYSGGWIIPTREMLCGLNADGHWKSANNLSAHFKQQIEMGAIDAQGRRSYWSSTEKPHMSSHVWTVSMQDGAAGLDHKDLNRHYCRPVRLELLRS